MCTGTISYKHGDNYRYKLSSCLPPYVNVSGSVAAFEFPRGATQTGTSGVQGVFVPPEERTGRIPGEFRAAFRCRNPERPRRRLNWALSVARVAPINYKERDTAA